MKAVAVTINGIEGIASEEIKEITKTKTKDIAKGRILFETKNLKPLEKARTITKLYKYIIHFKFKKEEEIYKKAEKTKFEIEKSFAVRCYREGKHNFRSKNIEAKVGEIIFERGHKVNLKKPETTVYIEVIQNTCIIGILHKKDMQKREYRIRLNSASINACLAASLIKISETEKEHIVVDPFCKDGVIIIESALQGIKKVHGFDESLNNVKNARINAQLAKTNISIGKAEIDWLETKFGKQSVDRIITNPPFPGKHKNKTEIDKTTKEFIEQAKYILKKEGILTVITQNSELIERYAKQNLFNKIKEIRAVIGNTIYEIQVLRL